MALPSSVSKELQLLEVLAAGPRLQPGQMDY